jgi:hypothetical protein
MWSTRWGQPPMRNTFHTKNTYENILTGINKEVHRAGLAKLDRCISEEVVL